MSDYSKDEAKSKFLEAIEKKKKLQSINKDGKTRGSKVTGGQASGNAPKMFRRKSGSA